MHNKTIIIIPSRIGSSRLNNKPLAMIGEHTMIEHVIRKVKETSFENILVATDDQKIVDIVKKTRADAILTDEKCVTGTDRVYDALSRHPKGEEFEYIVNVQGDMPFINPKTIINLLECLWKTEADIVTPVVKVHKSKMESDSNVKVISTKDNRALYFSRSQIPYKAQEFLYHVGIYGFKKESLKKFVHLPVGELESVENLEQLRALENGMSIELSHADTIPISVDTPDDLKHAIDHYNSRI